MENNAIINIGEVAPRAAFGGKAYWLSWLQQNGYPVPDAFFLPAEWNGTSAMAGVEHGFDSRLQRYKGSDGRYRVAIRSSAISEDGAEQSLAGHFKSFVDDYDKTGVLDRIGQVVASGSGNGHMGVIIQQKVEALLTGIAFSSNPITASKLEIVLSYVRGMGEQLMSGQTGGKQLIIRWEKGAPQVTDENEDISPTVIRKLCRYVKDMENKLGYPVDVEWCIDEQGKLFILQCRPVTGLRAKTTGVIPITLDNEKLIPQQVVNNDKVNIRLLAQRHQIDISNAYLVISDQDFSLTVENLAAVRTQERSQGYSVVLLYPKTISGNIIRQFADKEAGRQDEVYRTCQRYDVRSYQDHEHLLGVLQNIKAQCCLESWFCIAIIQEIFAPEYTGIAKKIGDGYLIEVARGHFVPKGVVPTSQYVVSTDGKITFRQEVVQDHAFHIRHGNVLKEALNEHIKLNDETLSVIVADLKPLLDGGVQAVEFGLLSVEGGMKPYLIDLVDDHSTVELSSSLLNEGVIACGKRTGKLQVIDPASLKNNSLEMHFHNERAQSSASDEALIFFASTPDIGLLELLKHYHDERIGFIFREGSALSHFSIILREKGIPAVVLSSVGDLTPGTVVSIDGETAGKPAAQRVTVVNACVTTYSNPDTDGVACALAYAALKQATGEAYVPVYFGKLDKESEFALAQLNAAPPMAIKDATAFDRICLVDTHHIAQLPPTIDPVKVTEIIDHHPNGDPSAFPNAVIENEQVGAAATLVAERYRISGIRPDRQVAGMLTFAIYSNTLNFSAPSTSDRDREALTWLEQYFKADAEIIAQLFEARSDISDIATADLIASNMKEFNWGGHKVGISQVELTSLKSLSNRQDLISEIAHFRQERGLEWLFFTAVNITAKNTMLVCPDKLTTKMLNEALGLSLTNEIAYVDRILMRKTDFIPQLQHYFTEQHT